MPPTDTGLWRWHSVLPSHLGVTTEVGCSELRKTWGSFSAFHMSHTEQAARAWKQTGNRLACLGQKKGLKVKVEILGRQHPPLPLGWTAEPAPDLPPIYSELLSSLALEIKRLQVPGQLSWAWNPYFESTWNLTRDKRSCPRDKF